VRTEKLSQIGKTSGRFEYKDGPNGFPLATRSIATVSQVQEGVEDSWEVDSTMSISQRKFDDYEFTLSAYGLPEPYGIAWKKRTPRYVWFLLAAAVAGCVAVGVRYYARSHRAAKG
jgi:hypothetical protein